MSEAVRSSIQSLLLSVFLLSSCTLQAFAYYHPDEGRWINRDPIGEEAFSQHVISLSRRRLAVDQMLRASKDLYLAFFNDPINNTDLNGLINVQGNYSPFSSDAVKTQILSTFNTLIEGVREPLQQAMRDNWNNMTFVCKNNSDEDCKQKSESGYTTREGLSRVGVMRDIDTTYTDVTSGGTTITLVLKQDKTWYNIATICPCNSDNLERLGVVGFHESAHAVGWGGAFKDDEDPAFNNLPHPVSGHPSGWGIPN